ncbi:MAG: 30S ribosome-binding factor RbfA [Candidatus Pacebacteria bacterium]|nr:30S ribosome-binding factor RbfA [Candidatus Paceibacterota bacterium]
MARRIPQVNQFIKKELAKIILREIDFPQGVLVTLTRAEVTANFQECKVYFSVLPETRAKDILSILRKLVYFLQKKLDERLKMRPVPKIMFFVETGTVEAGEIENILEKLKKEEK